MLELYIKQRKFIKTAIFQTKKFMVLLKSRCVFLRFYTYDRKNNIKYLLLTAKKEKII